MPRNAQRNAVRSTRTLACAAVALPVLLLAGCSSDSGGGDSSPPSGGSSPSKSKAPAPVKYKQLPDACKAISKDTVKDLAPKTDDAGGKRIGSGNTGDSGSCLWSGLDKYDYRQLTVSLKRFDSDASRGSGDKLATGYATQQIGDIKSDKDFKSVKTAPVSGIGDQAQGASYESDKKAKKSETFHSERVAARSANVVVTVDYEGAGFEDGSAPKSDDLKKKTQKAAKEAVGSLK